MTANKRHVFGLLVLCACVAGWSYSAAAAGSYYVGTTIRPDPVLWVYAPTTNLIKLCFPTSSDGLACTATQTVFAAIPGAKDDMQYRNTQSSPKGGLWILDLTTNKQALCEATLSGATYAISCLLGSGLK